MTSGAIQKGVPTNVFLLICVSVSCPATPKSASFTSPCSESSTLAAARQRTAGVTLSTRQGPSLHAAARGSTRPPGDTSASDSGTLAFLSSQWAGHPGPEALRGGGELQARGAHLGAPQHELRGPPRVCLS